MIEALSIESGIISVSGARVHNLKNISFEIPHNAITVVTGVSGSGKSSLAFDTIYAEGQRRYIESLSAYARQFLERIEKPDVDEISGIAPAIAIKQKNSTRNPRSTVATATEIYDYLRLLYARAGTHVLHPLRQRSAPRHHRRDHRSRPGTRARPPFLRPFPAWRSPNRRRRNPVPANPRAQPRQAVQQALVDLQRRGFNRLYQDGRVHEFSSPETLLDIDFSRPVYVLVDRLAIAPGHALAPGRLHRDLLSRWTRRSHPRISAFIAQRPAGSTCPAGGRRIRCRAHGLQ